MTTRAGTRGSFADSRRFLVGLFVIGLAVRLILARYSLGLNFDVSLFRTYVDRLMEFGLSGFYASGRGQDYPPVYLYVLFALGKGYAALRGVAPSAAVLKLPAIAADLGLAAVAMLLAARVTPADVARRLPARALASAAILLNPAVILISSVWGQVDSIPALLVLAAVLAFSGPPTLAREAVAVALLATAVATKPQAVLALPVFVVVLLHRWFDARPGNLHAIAGRSVLLTMVAVAVTAAIFAPFGISPTGIIDFYREGGEIYPFTSLWAFNAWGAVGFYRRDVGQEAFTVAGIAALYVGLAAFLVAMVTVAARSWQSFSRRVNSDVIVLFGVVAATCTGFALLTRMHERYLYLAIVALTPLVAVRVLRWALAVLSLCFLLNVHFVYVLFSQNLPIARRAWTIQPLFYVLFGRARDASELKALSVITTVCCLAVAFLGWRCLEKLGVAAPDRNASSARAATI